MSVDSGRDKRRRKTSRYLYMLRRMALFPLTFPFHNLPEGAFKSKVRKIALNLQHSLPKGFYINKGDTIVYVGTPWPKTMARLSAEVGEQGRVIIVEAMPENQDNLEAAIKEKSIKNVEVLRAAACNENKAGSLMVSPTFSADHKIALDGIVMDNDLREGNDEMVEIPVDFVRLDDALPKLGIEKVNFMSVTVNGAEAEVLRGSATILKESDQHTRVFAKGHALDQDGKPIHLQSEELMRSIGYETKITRGEPSSTTDKSWLRRAGDLYAWKAH